MTNVSNFEVIVSKELLEKCVTLSVSSEIYNKNISKFIGPVFSEAPFFPSRNPEVSFSEARERATLLLMERALDMGANAVVNLTISTAPYKAQGSGWGCSMIVAYGNAVVIDE